MTINILHLYPKEMNLYGDRGNILTLRRRCEWRGYDVNVIAHEPGSEIPSDIDIIFGGGGQDSGQSNIEEDVKRITPILKQMVEDETPALVICGLYQLFGNYFETYEGQKIQGMGILNLHTIGGKHRLIGNVVIESKEFGRVVGYENHSGLTYLGDGLKSFGNVIVGDGNNGKDGKEGVRYKNCIGTYLHGPILPKNPAVADFLIQTAIRRKTANPDFVLEELDNSVELSAQKSASKRPR